MLTLSAVAGAVDLHVTVQDAGGSAALDAIVYAVPATPIAPNTGARATIDQVNRQFVPRVSVIQAGTAVEFPNSDNIRHSVYSFSPAKVFTLKLYAGKPANPVIFDQPGVVVLGCNIHDGMIAWVLVVNTPFFARTDASGAATLTDLPAGEYTLRAWHASMPEEQAGEALHVGPGSLPARMLRIDTRIAATQPGDASMDGMHADGKHDAGTPH